MQTEENMVSGIFCDLLAVSSTLDHLQNRFACGLHSFLEMATLLKAHVHPSGSAHLSFCFGQVHLLNAVF